MATPKKTVKKATTKKVKKVVEPEETVDTTATPETVPYIIKFTLAGVAYDGEGATPLEALRSLATPTKIFGKGVLTISHGERTKTLLLMPMKVRRLFWTGRTQEVSAKILGMGL